MINQDTSTGYDEDHLRSVFKKRNFFNRFYVDLERA